MCVVLQVLAAVREHTINYVQVSLLTGTILSPPTLLPQCSLGDKGQPTLKLLRKFEVPFEIMAFQVHTYIHIYTPHFHQ